MMQKHQMHLTANAESSTDSSSNEFSASSPQQNTHLAMSMNAQTAHSQLAVAAVAACTSHAQSQLAAAAAVAAAACGGGPMVQYHPSMMAIRPSGLHSSGIPAAIPQPPAMVRLQRFNHPQVPSVPPLPAGSTAGNADERYDERQQGHTLEV